MLALSGFALAQDDAIVAKDIKKGDACLTPELKRGKEDAYLTKGKDDAQLTRSKED